MSRLRINENQYLIKTTKKAFIEAGLKPIGDGRRPIKELSFTKNNLFFYISKGGFLVALDFDGVAFVIHLQSYPYTKELSFVIKNYIKIHKTIQENTDAKHSYLQNGAITAFKNIEPIYIKRFFDDLHIVLSMSNLDSIWS